MAVDVAKPVVEIRDFQGIVTGVDLLDIPAGASSEQTNCLCIRPGELLVRRGLRPVVFDSMEDVLHFADEPPESEGYLLLESGNRIII